MCVAFFREKNVCRRVCFHVVNTPALSFANKRTFQHGDCNIYICVAKLAEFLEQNQKQGNVHTCHGLFSLRNVNTGWDFSTPAGFSSCSEGGDPLRVHAHTHSYGITELIVTSIRHYWGISFLLEKPAPNKKGNTLSVDQTWFGVEESLNKQPAIFCLHWNKITEVLQFI